MEGANGLHGTLGAKGKVDHTPLLDRLHSRSIHLLILARSSFGFQVKISMDNAAESSTNGLRERRYSMQEREEVPIPEEYWRQQEGLRLSPEELGIVRRFYQDVEEMGARARARREVASLTRRAQRSIEDVQQDILRRILPSPIRQARRLPPNIRFQNRGMTTYGGRISPPSARTTR